MRAVAIALIACLAWLVSTSDARASFLVPPIEGHVTDTARVLKQEERADLELRLAEYMSRSGVEIAVFVVGSLQGESIEDVAYKTFNTWRVGRAGLDNGVLLVIAPKERRVRIETGKGVGGQLTDLQASDIIEHRIAPQLREGRYRDAIADGTEAIAAALGSQPTPEPGVQPVAAFVGGLVVLVLISIALRRGRFARPLFWRGGGGRGGGFGGGGGYSGGGGRSGGGGASGSW
jgi:uncharacterized protein